MTEAPSDNQPEAQSPAKWGFWGTCLWGLLVGFVFVFLQSVTILVGLIVRGAVSTGFSGPEFDASVVAASENGTLLSIATFITALVGCGMIAGIVKLKHGSVLTEYLALRPVPVPVCLKWCGVGVGFLVFSDLTTMAMGRPVVPEFMTDVYATAHPAWLLWLALVVGAPLFEETFFRGFLMKGLAASALKPVGAVVVTAFLWALLHLQYDLYGIFTIFLMGLLFGIARIRTRSLAVPLALHALANLAATIEVALLG
jgi:membrane protease YdiL (CAAX protease family)